jgi:hypothetical protein
MAMELPKIRHKKLWTGFIAITDWYREIAVGLIPEAEQLMK